MFPASSADQRVTHKKGHYCVFRGQTCGSTNRTFLASLLVSKIMQIHNAMLQVTRLWLNTQ